MSTEVISVDATKIRGAREHLGLSAAEAARKIGITYQYLWAIETGVKKPSWETLTQLCAVYDKRLNFFLAGPQKFLEKV